MHFMFLGKRYENAIGKHKHSSKPFSGFVSAAHIKNLRSVAEHSKSLVF